jgi:hypothetical protein
MLEKANSLFLRLFARIRTLPAKHNCMPLMSPDPKDSALLHFSNQLTSRFIFTIVPSHDGKQTHTGCFYLQHYHYRLAQKLARPFFLRIFRENLI